MNQTFGDFDFSATFDNFRGGPRPLDEIRLLVVDARDGSIAEDKAANLGRYLLDDDVLSVNEVGIGPSRLKGTSKAGQAIDVCFLLEVEGSGGAQWEAVVLSETEPPCEGDFSLAAGKVRGIFRGKLLDFDGSYWLQKDRYVGYRGVVELTDGAKDLRAAINEAGLLMHPWYADLHELEKDALNPSNVAHSNAVLVSEPARRITPEHWAAFRRRGIGELPFALWMSFSWRQAQRSTGLPQYRMNRERLLVSESSVNALKEAVARRRRIVCVGTSGARALESLEKQPKPFDGTTDLFIRPGHQFRYCSSLLTNLHNPMGTHVIMACAFGGRELVLEACERAVQSGMRFGIHGDSMLIHGSFEPLAWSGA